MAKPGRPTDYRKEFSEECPEGKRDPNCRHVICHMAGGKSKESYAARIGSGYRTIYDWVDEHEEFSQAIKRGESLSLLWWEDLMQAGTAGQLRSLTSEDYGKGGQVVKRTFKAARFQPVGALFTMKNRFPALYRDRIDLRHEVPDPDGDLSGKTLAELAEESDRLNAEIKRARKK